MSGRQSDRETNFDEFVRAVNRKLVALRPVLTQSLSYGRMTWRMRPNGEIEIKVEPKL